MTEIKVRISDDYYKAYLSVQFDDEPVTMDDIMSALDAKAVVFGIDSDVIEAILSLEEDVYEELVAEGKPHINGIDSEIHYIFKPTHQAKPVVDENGKVNFKELDLLQKVSKGEVLAYKTQATEGMDGMTVTGKVIHGKNGRDYQMKIGENVELDEKGLEAKATCDGIYKFENDKMFVKNYLEFDHGVGVETGNVDFKGDIIVNGNVTDGYTITCDGNLTINGMVEGSYLNVTGDLVITKGVSGHKVSIINCDGNFTTQYIDHAEVNVKGNLEAGEILNCQVMCNGEVEVKGKKGHIIGGEITAKYAITATTIGSKLGVITLINLGVDIESVKELRALKQDIQTEKENEKKLLQFIKILKGKAEKGIITDEETETLNRCIETLEQSRYQIKEMTGRLNNLREMLIKAQQGQIKTETIYPDALVKIGQSHYFIDEVMLRSIIRKSHDEIVAIGF